VVNKGSALDYSTKKVLLIESSGNMRSTVVHMLRGMGVQNIKAITINSHVFVEIEQIHYDVVLLGHNNSETFSGAQVLEEARFRGLLKPSVAWIFMTGDASQEIILQAVDSKPDAVITKPFSVDELKRRLDMVLAQKSMLRPVLDALERKEWEEALLICDRDFDPQAENYERVAVLKARALAELNQHHEAVEVLEEVFWRKHDREVAFTWASMAFEMDQFDVARDLLQDLIQRNPLMISVYDKLAELHEKTGDIEAAVDILQEATARAPLGIPRQMKLGHVATLNQDYNSASGAYQKSIVLGRRSCYRSTEPYLRLANIRRLEMEGADHRSRAGLVETIHQLLFTAQNKFPHDESFRVKAELLKAEVAKAQSKTEVERRHLKAAEVYNAELEEPLDLERERLDVLRDQVPVLEEEEEEKPVDAMLESAQDPAMSLRINRQGVKQYLAGKYVQAIKHFSLAVDYDRTNPAALLNLAQLFIETARDSVRNREERLKMADRYLKLTMLMSLEGDAQEKAELLRHCLDKGVESIPDGSLGALLR